MLMAGKLKSRDGRRHRQLAELEMRRRGETTSICGEMSVRKQRAVKRVYNTYLQCIRHINNDNNHYPTTTSSSSIITTTTRTATNRPTILLVHTACKQTTLPCTGRLHVNCEQLCYARHYCVKLESFIEY